MRELDKEELRPQFKLRCHNAFADAVADLGRPEQNRQGSFFSGFQCFQYETYWLERRQKQVDD